MKSGALDALIAEIRTSETNFYSASAVEHFIEKAFIAGQQVAFSAALHECNEQTQRYAISTQNFDAAVQVAEAVEARWRKETLE
jgi:hypothetical protein